MVKPIQLPTAPGKIFTPNRASYGARFNCTTFMKYLLIVNKILLALLLASCTNQGIINSGKSNISGSQKSDKPLNLNNYIIKNFPGWQLVNTNDYVKSWWSFYDRNVQLYQVITDINDDTKEDYALLLKKADSLQIAFIISTPKGYTHWIDPDFNKKISDQGGLHFGLTVEVPGRIDVALPEIKSLILKSNAVNVMDFEERAAVYYWNNGKVNVFKTN